MHRTGNAGIETVDGAQNLDRLFWVMQFVAFECGFIGAIFSLIVTWSGIPCGRDYRLVVVDLGVFDHNYSSLFHERLLPQRRMWLATCDGSRVK